MKNIRIVIWTTGGTIACQNAESERKPGNISNLIDLKPYQVDFKEIISIESSQIRPSDWKKIISKTKLLDTPNTAFILTASHSPHGYKGSDAEINLLRACKLAKKGGLPAGVYVLIRDHLFFGGTTRKIRTRPKKDGVYILGKEAGCFDSKGEFKLSDTEIKKQPKSKATEIITHGSDTIEYSSFVLTLLHKKKFLEAAKYNKSKPINFGQSEILDVDKRTPLEYFENAVKRVKKRLLANKNQGLIIIGDIKNQDIIKYLDRVANKDKIPILVQTTDYECIEDLFFHNIGTVFKICDIFKTQIKFNLLLGFNTLSFEKIYSLMNKDFVGEVIYKSSPTFKRINRELITAIPNNCRLIKAFPGMDHLQIEDAVMELKKYKNPKIVLCAYGDGNFPLDNRAEFLERFKDNLTKKDYQAIKKQGLTISNQIIEIKKVLAKTKKEQEKLFWRILREDKALDSIIKAKSNNIKVYLGTLVKESVPDMTKYEPGWILQELLGVEPLKAKFTELKKL